ncbi:carbohydrate-binding domain-containing protein, partial [Aureimonas sp. Leaf454]|uniref:carbohydrate-binding domain-containing protein n=1 Tax=Aureimonas sp. Leaf454 TaxID=1736381 RepID=UPI00244E996B
VQTARASHAAGKSDTITVKGDWSQGDHKVSVHFLNDIYGGTASTDRNLYVDGATYNGAVVAGGDLSMHNTGIYTFTLQDVGLI